MSSIELRFEVPGEPRNIVLWSGGKDSTATLILAHLLGIKIDLVIMSLLWFDKKRGIYGEQPEKIDWVLNHAKPMLENFGFRVELVSSDKDYMYWFYKIREKSRNPDMVGKYYGFLIGGFCKMQGEKVMPIKKFLKEQYTQRGVHYQEIAGICADEKERLERMYARGQRSLLAEQNYTQADTIALCKEYGLLAPGYTDGVTKRDGCWYCPNQNTRALAALKINHPELWGELQELGKVENTVARGFKYGKPFAQVEAEVDRYIENPPPIQMSML